ncbi:MAG: hypothetical protein CM15mP109_12140 [Candidatus Dadabacteria bacterium]|nr:MAG: hypothetical protein CM15mP109_12140 [Candidatus Dadabacteria bacterium]
MAKFSKASNCLGPSGEVIPFSIIEKEPTAELREDQKDQDSPLHMIN